MTRQQALQFKNALQAAKTPACGLVTIFVMIRLIRKPPPEAGLTEPAPAQQAVSPRATERDASEG